MRDKHAALTGLKWVAEARFYKHTVPTKLRQSSQKRLLIRVNPLNPR